MHPELEKLVHLQQIDQRIAALTSQIANYPRRIGELENRLRDSERRLEDNLRLQEHEEKSRRKMESDAADLRQKSLRYRKQLDTVQSDEQAQAFQHQIDFCQHEVERIEELELASLMLTETLEAQHAELTGIAARQKQSLADETIAARSSTVHDETERAELTREREALRPDIDDSLLAEYDRIAAGHKSPMAEVSNQRCSACQMMLRPQLWNEIRNGVVHFCESCGRLLYYNPPVDLSDALRDDHHPASAKKPAGPAKSSPTNSSAQRKTASGTGDPSGEN